MTKKLKWRLGKLPTSDEVLELVKASLITKDEARNILFSQESEETIKDDALKAEIKFLRELIDKLASRSEIITQIKYIEKQYQPWYWHQPYMVWCQAYNNLGTQTALVGGSSLTNYSTNVGTSATAGTVGSSTLQLSGTSNFSEIKTF